MGSVTQDKSCLVSKDVPITETPDADAHAVARQGDFDALNRLSAILAPICAVLSEHIMSSVGDDERRMVEPLANAAGDTFVAVRLAR
jgi:hypothetical protein